MPRATLKGMMTFCAFLQFSLWSSLKFSFSTPIEFHHSKLNLTLTLRRYWKINEKLITDNESKINDKIMLFSLTNFFPGHSHCRKSSYQIPFSLPGADFIKPLAQSGKLIKSYFNWPQRKPNASNLSIIFANADAVQFSYKIIPNCGNTTRIYG